MSGCITTMRCTRCGIVHTLGHADSGLARGLSCSGAIPGIGHRWKKVRHRFTVGEFDAVIETAKHELNAREAQRRSINIDFRRGWTEAVQFVYANLVNRKES